MDNQLINALSDCISVMERELNGLAVIQPELKAAREALAAASVAPTAWTGEGLPPVGIVCEVKSGYGELPTFMPCEVIAHFDGETKRCAAYVYTQHDGTRLVGQGTEQAFRPVPTPEQIAAEEREKAVHSMLRIMGEAERAKDGKTLALYELAGAYAQALHDAGYRKLEGGAA